MESPSSEFTPYDRDFFMRSLISSGWSSNEAIEKISIASKMELPLYPYYSVSFEVLLLATKKFAATSKADKFLNPFLKENRGPMYICRLTDSHVLIYNKFPIVPYHVLVITDHFVKQNSMLTDEDFKATLITMKAMKGFAFFNSGPDAGSSQGHKHLQVIPIQSYACGRIPVDILVESERKKEGWFQLPCFRFKHLFYCFKDEAKDHAEFLAEIYMEALKRLNNEDLAYAYNVVLTPKWFLIVLRKQEKARSSIRVNAVGFTGSFAVRSEEELEVFKRGELFNVLEDVTFPLI